jgi:hypothetical protein
MDTMAIFGLCGLVVIDTFLGRKAEAHRTLEQLAVDNFAMLERDSANRPARLGLLAEVVYELDAPQHAPWLYEQLQPLPDRCLAGHFGCLCLGATARYLALLATTLQRWDDTERHFADAVERNERIGARPFAAHSRHEWADMLVRRGDRADLERALALNDQALDAAEEMGMTWLAGKALALKARLQGMLGA